jgi:hypothetical protein
MHPYLAPHNRPAALAAALVASLAAVAPCARAQHTRHAVTDTTVKQMPGMPGMPGMPAAPRPAPTLRAVADTAAHAAMPTMAMARAPLDIPMRRRGSGTSWLPDASPMYAAHSMLGGWDVMLHGLAFLQYDDQQSKRGDRQLGSVNWGMAMATHALAGGTLSLSGMLSAEPFTVGARGYPLLLQSGEAYHGVPLHDRQHPHDLFMELAAKYDHVMTPDAAVFVYAAPVGEPALGPVAFPHRPSAANDPLAPIGHHWQDATHISFGVLTAGVYTRMVRLEGSVFNGREPDENRTNFDYRGRSLDSYAGRVTVNPSDRWSVSASYGYLKSPEALAPDESVHRMTASVLYGRPLGMTGDWSSAFIYGGNKHPEDARVANSYLAETNVDLDGRNTVFGRGEIVEKTGDDLALGTGARLYTVGELTLGYVRELATVFGGSLGAGVAGTANFIPSSIDPVYGTRAPLGVAVFLRLRPGRMKMSGAMHGPTSPDMPGMRTMSHAHGR